MRMRIMIFRRGLESDKWTADGWLRKERWTSVIYTLHCVCISGVGFVSVGCVLEAVRGGVSERREHITVVVDATNIHVHSGAMKYFLS